MKNEKILNEYYLGLDIGTDSIGYAVTNSEYNLLKFKGEPMWGVHLFDAANLKDERRAFRSARRRLDRRQQRVKLVQELFASEISKMDEHFYTRIADSYKYPEDCKYGSHLFCDENYSDKEYYKQYPTIHHLICELMESDTPHDARLVYLACAWLVAHRGHFLYDVSEDNVANLSAFSEIYDNFMHFFESEKPWYCEDTDAIKSILGKKTGINNKYRELCQLLYGQNKAEKEIIQEGFPYSKDGILKLLCGGEYQLAKLFGKDEYSQLEKTSISLGMNDEDIAKTISDLEEDGELIVELKRIYDFILLDDIKRGEQFISAAKVKVFEEHQEDLKFLKSFIRNHTPQRYNEVFRNSSNANYSAYVGNFSGSKVAAKKVDVEKFSKYIESIVKCIVPNDDEAITYADMISRLETRDFLPKQVDTDNRVIPYQLYLYELTKILNNASHYLNFLNDTDEDGISVKDKIISIFTFRVPYFVGPLNLHSKNAWLKRKAEGKIYPWNFERLVDLDKSEDAFIKKMTNSCTYLPEDVLPKCSMLYQSFEVLNEINNIKILGKPLPVEAKQALYHGLFEQRKKVTPKAIREFLVSNNYYTYEDVITISGIDDTIKSSLSSYLSFKNLLSSGSLSPEDVEKIIERSTYAEDKSRLSRWLKENYPKITEADRSYICKLKLKDFGRLSRKLLNGITHIDKETCEVSTVIELMWQTNGNLMELLSDRYSFKKTIDDIQKEYYALHPMTLDERLESMYISNAVKRPIYRTFDIINDVVKANGQPPKKIFIEMARGATEDQKGKRTHSRLDQLKEWYTKFSQEDLREVLPQLNAMGEDAERKLQSEKLYLYYLQLGKCAYSGTPISLDDLSNEDIYNIDHIYPQSKVKDDSIHNNKVLVLSKINGTKGDTYPIFSQIREKMTPFWKKLHENGLMNDEKYRRLTRNTPFDENEEWGFINRQLVETRQSTKVIATLLNEKYPETEIVYVKAGLVSDFRQAFDMIKSRAVNDLHHAKDAYLNIVVGNVYNSKFTYQWFKNNQNQYNLKVKTLFGHPVTVNDNVIWRGEADVELVQNIVRKKNAVHLTRYSLVKYGGFFNQTLYAPNADLIPLKNGKNLYLEPEKYGGYNSASVSCFILAKYNISKKSELSFVGIKTLFKDNVLLSEESAIEYIRNEIPKATNISLPFGLRLIKTGTTLELDGMKVFIPGKAGISTLSVSLMSPLIVGYEYEQYIKHLEKFNEKIKSNPNLIYSKAHDNVSTEENIRLYDLLTEKLKSKVYSKLPASPLSLLIKGRDEFVLADVKEQAKCLMQILVVFARKNGCDLKLIGGGAGSAKATLSIHVSNWSKNYKVVRIIDSSASGLFEKKSENLLDLL